MDTLLTVATLGVGGWWPPGGNTVTKYHMLAVGEGNQQGRERGLELTTLIKLGIAGSWLAAVGWLAAGMKNPRELVRAGRGAGG